MIPIAKPFIGDEEIKEVEAVLRSGFIAQGPKVAEFEEKFAEYVGTRHAVATSSGTTALHVALLCAGIGKGDEVITTPFSFAATANSVLYAGGKPVFVDIDPKTYNINPEKIEEAITDKTKAILPVHLYGQPADMDQICKIAEDHDLKVIEDAAQAHGAIYHGKKVGSIGDMACFSFYPTKNITTGEGGIITTDDDAFDKDARAIRAHGESERYEHVTLGYNFRMTDIAAAIGVVQLKRLEEFNEKRIENAEYLTEHINSIEGIESPYVASNVRHVFHQYTVRVEDGKRDELKEFLNNEGIGTGVHYPRTIYNQKLYEDLGYTADCPEAEKAAAEVLSLPVNPTLTAEDFGKIVSVLQDASDKIFK
ncbi:MULTISPECIES: DegT/DnrJ/EryC1/StrS family aminotransferase [Methanobacterium]|jgi:dTDP-4-amino-4,6-dideoxygalactose transaminase|uniref:DegT/DnrJ/EryC1/StrS family aminotransferase n=1 Tax=Methanobacterium veterum TaxID=408577 RepID=A0A9E5DNT2_9EURY|nr:MULTISPECIES: DegT/DnrJ/EryC1/StrS family aminotransferase [Methanobacterium]MCZ3366149.1 DegT/DnrJ/EryC1/StrS family aminotransferase [Methanobacterium veterum]MCZ3371623.1 DegT/DnrJ/EryC1/StrS family aminotransferase [Methanobacterium veterum]